MVNARTRSGPSLWIFNVLEADAGERQPGRSYRDCPDPAAMAVPEGGGAADSDGSAVGSEGSGAADSAGRAPRT